MKAPTTDELASRYGELSKEDLIRIHRESELTDTARAVLHTELERRGISLAGISDNTTLREDSRVTSRLTPKEFRFTGNVKEYFRIWAVNVFLTIATLGIYSAWAKVRTNRYFYGNTVLDGSPFDYDAKPTSILKGRMLAGAVIIVYLITINYYPGTEPIFGLAFLLVLPWLIVMAFAFRARYSSYHNVRFGFVGSFGGAAALFYGWGLITVLTLGIAYPSFVAHRYKFLINYTRFGATPLSFETVLKDFYWAYFIAVLLALIIAIPGFMAISSVMTMLTVSVQQPVPGSASIFAGVIAFLQVGLLVVLYSYVKGYLKAAITNSVFRNTAIRDHRFESKLQARMMIWLYLSNAVAIVCSIGLLVPWARIRLARYRADHLTLLAASELDGFAAEERQKTAAAGEELSDLLDVDVGI